MAIDETAFGADEVSVEGPAEDEPANAPEADGVGQAEEPAEAETEAPAEAPAEAAAE